MPTIEVVQGDLLEQPVEAIVNPWNRNIIPWWLLLPQGVSGAIKRRAYVGHVDGAAQAGQDVFAAGDAREPVGVIAQAAKAPQGGTAVIAVLRSEDVAAGLARAVANGITDAAHMPRDRMPDELIAQMAARGVAMSPTIAVYEALAAERGNLGEWRRTVLPVMYDNLRRFVAAGGQLTLGDDYGNPGIALGMPMAELRHWIAAGLGPMQAIVASTSAAAAACGLSSQIGTLRPGMAADLFAVAGDPLADIGALEQVRLVLHNGAVVREE